jgi:hypothetical protein
MTVKSLSGLLVQPAGGMSSIPQVGNFRRAELVVGLVVLARVAGAVAGPGRWPDRTAGATTGSDVAFVAGCASITRARAGRSVSEIALIAMSREKLKQRIIVLTNPHPRPLGRRQH